MKHLRFESILSFVNRWPDNNPADTLRNHPQDCVPLTVANRLAECQLEVGLQVIAPAVGQERDLAFTETRFDPRLSVDRRWISCG
jgi:hypothetical protein